MKLITDVLFEEGRVKGRVKGEASMLIRQLERRFGDIPRQVRTRVSKASHEQLEGWGFAVLDAKSLDGVFNGKGDS